LEKAGDELDGIEQRKAAARAKKIAERPGDY